MIDLYNFDKEKNIYKDDFMALFKNEFNNRIARIEKAERYYKLETTTDADVEKTLNEFLKIYDELIILSNEFKKIFGYELGYEIMINGFKE